MLLDKMREVYERERSYSWQLSADNTLGDEIMYAIVPYYCNMIWVFGEIYWGKWDYAN